MPEFVINLIIIAILAVVLGGIIFYIVKEKKSGAKCISCPYAKTCGKSKNGGCSCH